MLISAPALLPVAFIYGKPEASAHLRAVLEAVKADVVYDTKVDALDAAVLSGSGARVALINLDAAVQDRLDDVYATLDDCGCRVVFDDPETSAALAGWEHARWERHLVAKLCDTADVDPPRPADASPVDVEAVAHEREQWLESALNLLHEEPAVAAPAGADEVTADLAVDDMSVGADAAGVDLGDTGDDLVIDWSLLDEAVAALPPDVPPAPEAVIAESDLADPATPPVTEAVQAAADVNVDTDTDTTTDTVFADNLMSSSDDDDFETLAAAIGESPTVPADDVALGLDDLLAARPPPVEASAAPEHAVRPGEPDPTSMSESAPAAAQTSSSEWSLVDDTLPPAPSGRPAFGVDDEDGRADERASNAARQPGAAAAAALASREFNIELIDPSDYLAPEAPQMHEAELYAAPELMSMSDAIMPQLVETDAEGMAPAVPVEDIPSAAPHSASLALLPRVVVMAASIGGPDAVRAFLSAVPARFPALFVLAQHMDSEFTDLLVEQLSKAAALPVRLAIDGQRAVVGEVLVVPGERCFRVARDGTVGLAGSGGADAQQPSVGASMAAVAEEFDSDTLAIVFSGMVDDAVAGAQAVARHGGEVWLQDAGSCVVSSMVDAVAAAGAASFSGTPAALAQRLVAMYSEELQR